MKEQERADWLARAIDDLVRSRGDLSLPPGLEDEEILSLLRVARARLQQAQATAQSGLHHEAAVWQRVLERLQTGKPEASSRHDPTFDEQTIAGELAITEDPEAAASPELREVAQLRQRMAQDLRSLAEGHREDVWQRVQARLQAQTQRRKRGLWAFLRRGRSEADALAPALDDVARGASVWSTDPQVEELLRIARSRKALSQMAANAASEPQDRVWARLRPGLAARAFGAAPESLGRQALGHARVWPKLAAAAAAVAIAAAALGPLPATGFAEHPAARFIRYIGQHLGVTETSTPPPARPGEPDTVAGTEVSPRDAAALMLLPVRVPSVVPTGMRLASSQFFPKAITAPAGGTFVLTYEPSEGADGLAIYQEAAGGADLAVLQGSATDLVLADGTPATFYRGSWQVSDGSFRWDQQDSVSLVFQRDGIRTIIRHSGADVPPATLVAIADSMMPAQ